MYRKIRFFIPSMIMLAMLVGLTGCAQVTGQSGGNEEQTGKPTIKIGYLPLTHAAPLFIEDELGKGKFTHFQLELVKFGSWPDLMDALNAGKIDGASVLIQLAMKAKEQGIDLKAVALGHRDGNAIVTTNDIQSVADLHGKNFAIPHKLSTHNILLYEMLKREGLPYNHVNVVELPPAEMPAALSEGRISGYAVAEPFGAKSVVIEKGKAFLQSEELWKNSVDCALVLRGELISDNREAVEEFVTEYAKAGEKTELKDEQVKSILSNYMNVDDKVLDLSLQWIAYDDLQLNAADYEKLREYLIEMDISEKPPTYEEFVDNSFMVKGK